MKLGVSSYSFKKYMAASGCDYIKICDLAKEFSFAGIEFTPLENVDDPMAAAREIKEHCDKIGLEVIAYTVGANLIGDKADACVLERFCYIDVAEALGAKTLRHDVCYSLPKGLYTYREAIEEMVPRIRRVTEYAAAKGIRTCTENHGFIFQAPERVRELIHAVDNDNYGWLSFEFEGYEDCLYAIKAGLQYLRACV